MSNIVVGQRGFNRSSGAELEVTGAKLHDDAKRGPVDRDGTSSIRYLHKSEPSLAVQTSRD